MWTEEHRFSRAAGARGYDKRDKIVTRGEQASNEYHVRPLLPCYLRDKEPSSSFKWELLTGRLIPESRYAL